MTSVVTLRRWGLGIILHIAWASARRVHVELFACDQSSMSDLPAADRAHLIGSQ